MLATDIYALSHDTSNDLLIIVRHNEVRKFFFLHDASNVSPVARQASNYYVMTDWLIAWSHVFWFFREPESTKRVK